jgi:hypothetical protein
MIINKSPLFFHTCSDDGIRIAVEVFELAADGISARTIVSISSVDELSLGRGAR